MGTKGAHHVGDASEITPKDKFCAKEVCGSNRSNGKLIAARERKPSHWKRREWETVHQTPFQGVVGSPKLSESPS